MDNPPHHPIPTPPEQPAPQTPAPVPIRPAAAPPVTAPARPRKKRGWLIGGIITGVVLLVALVCCAGSGLTWYAYDQGNLDEILDRTPSASPSQTAEPSEEHVVRYEVEGSGKALVTWARPTGGTDSEQVDLPWSIEVEVNRRSFGAMVLAFPRGEGAELTGCRISIDGEERNATEAKAGVVACSAEHRG